MDQTKHIQEMAEAQELCALTDALLAGQATEKSEQAPLAGVVQRLAITIDAQPPPYHLRHKIKQQIAVEWARQHPSRPQTLIAGLGQQLRWLFTSPQRRLAWASVAVAAVAIVAAALLMPAGTGQLTATVAGGGTTLVVVLVVVGLLVVGWLAARRR